MCFLVLLVANTGWPQKGAKGTRGNRLTANQTNLRESEPGQLPFGAYRQGCLCYFFTLFYLYLSLPYLFASHFFTLPSPPMPLDLWFYSLDLQDS